MFMNDDKIYITQTGYDKLQKMKNLYNESKPLLSEKINRAKAHGDLKENSEYQLAMEEKTLLDKKLSTLNNIIANCYIIDISKIVETKIIYGASIKLEKISDKSLEHFILVSDHESDVDNHLLSISSLFGKKLLGKRVGEIITFNEEDYTITSVEYNAQLVEDAVNKSSEKELNIIEKSIKESFNY
jgi:transcription elongation factor GreA